jgi:predicted transcriptional regulator
MTETNTTLQVLIGEDTNTYEAGRDAIERLDAGESPDEPPTVLFPDEHTLAEVFNERTYELLRVITIDHPESIRETARLVGRDKKNVHDELTMLEAIGVIRLRQNGRAKQPVFPYDDIIVRPLADRPLEHQTA